jgi:hypothetical protein
VGNFIGTNRTGTAAVGNGGFGIHVNAGAANTIGGASAIDSKTGRLPGRGNLVSANATGGILLQAATGTLVQGNYVVTGARAQGNGLDGVHLEGGASNNTVGGKAAGSRNVIAANGTQAAADFDHGVKIAGLFGLGDGKVTVQFTVPARMPPGQYAFIARIVGTPAIAGASWDGVLTILAPVGRPGRRLGL